MGRDKMKSASLHSFHEEHTEQLPPVPAAGARTSFESLVREMLDQLGEDPSREGLRQTPARVETSLKWLTRGYHMSVADVIGDALYSERHENLVCVRDIEIYSLCEHHLLPFFSGARRLPAERPLGRSLQDPTRDRGVCPPATGAGSTRRPGSGRAHGRTRAARCGCRDRGVPSLHDDARRREAELQDDHERPAGCAAPRREDPGRIPAAGVQRPGPGVSDASPAALAGKLALVTGASRGIGLAVAELLHAAGAHVVRLARSLVDGTTDRRTDLRCDVTDPAAVERAVGRVLKDRGIPDIVVNNAGIFFIKPVAETTPDEFSRTLAVNLTAPFLVTRALVPHLVRRGAGHFVTIGSISDHVAFTGSTAYAASKFGLRGMHEVLRAELSRTGVRTTIVSPGPVDTPIWDPIDPDGRPGFTRRDAILQAGDVAEAVLFAVTRAPRVDVTEIRLLPTVYSLRG